LNDLQDDIQRRLSSAEPEVEVLLAEAVAPDRVRLVIDHPEGVSLGLCERVTHHLGELLANYGLEVSSPGPERPLTKPEHFERYIGRRARVRTRSSRDGRRSFAGELVAATDSEVTVASDAGVVSIPYRDIQRSNLLEG
jgi:ribosome maturation factor RimP